MKFYLILGLWSLMWLGSFSNAQTADLTTTDPNQIAAECGGDAGRGADLFDAKCSACHDISPANVSKSGPNLHGVVGRLIASHSEFPFSPALVAHQKSGTIWEQQNLHKYLMDPQGYAPGTTMKFDGFANQQDMFDVMTYIRTASLPPPPERGTIKVPPELAAIQGDATYGEYLAGECMTCHQKQTTDDGLAVINGWDQEMFMIALLEYKLRARQCGHANDRPSIGQRRNRGFGRVFW